MFTAALFTKAKKWKQPKSGQNVVCPRGDYESASHRKKTLTQVTARLSPKDVTLSGQSQSRRDRYCTPVLP